MRIVPRAMAHRRDRLQPATVLPDTADCPPCHIGKQTRVPFQADLESAQEPLKKVQTGTTGPIEPPDLHGDRYAQVTIDAATENTGVDFLKSKSAATKAILQRIQTWQLKINRTTKRYHAYGAPELHAPARTDKLRDQGRSNTKTAPHSLTQNAARSALAAAPQGILELCSF
jgi:hypothetical protein